MAATISKRNQARNEQALQELIKNIPGNDRCADCQARSPGWASWSLGIFLCMRCAALHRKLGTHISKVKSLSMDQWTNEQVENMKKIGNTKSNDIWNPRHKRAPIPLDVDEVDSAMERFIRQKYETKVLIDGLDRPTPRSPSLAVDRPAALDDTPPTPPPKAGRKFGFSLRSSSSTSFLSRSSKEDKRKAANIAPLTLNKESRVFGATIGVTESDKGLEMKLVQLREMGFPDIKRNTSVLRGNGGNLERTIESLVRLGEGSQPRAPIAPAPAKQEESQEYKAPNGASIVKPPVNQQHSLADTTPIERSTNPWEGQKQSATSAFDSAMAKMTISSPQQTSLFPNSTGGHIQQAQSPIYQQPIPQYHNNPYAQPQSQYVQTPIHNPFMMIQPISAQPTTNPYLSQNIHSPNPFMQQTTTLFSPQYSTFSPQQAMFSPQQQNFNPPVMPDFTSQQAQSPAFVSQSPAGYHNPYQQLQAFSAQPTGRLDKKSILALYNTPQATPVQPPQEEFAGSAGLALRTPDFGSPHRSVTMPAIGSKNPFASMGNSGLGSSSRPQ